MAEESQQEEQEKTFAGCYGSQVAYADMLSFLDDVFVINRESEKSGSERFSTCIWGHSGIGKTALIKQSCRRPVTWCGKDYPGYRVIDVPLAQFEEMGDLHGMPERHVLVGKKNGEGPVERWVAESVVNGYMQDGWRMVHRAGTRTMYAPPDWVPHEPGPAILLLDDWNRASVRIIKGCMQLLQNYGMVSWSLPAGCNIVLTANPDEQDYLVTSLDSAILTRQRHITLSHDEKEWAIWATGAKIDPRVINYVLRYPEMMIGPERTNPRTLSEVGRSVRGIHDLSNKSNMKRFSMMAHSLLDSDTVASLVTFMERDVELCIEPEQILGGDPMVGPHIKKLMTEREKRVDVLGVICSRLFATMVQPDTEITKKSIANFQEFLTGKYIPEDVRHNFCMRMAGRRDARTNQWVTHNRQLTKLIMDVV